MVFLFPGQLISHEYCSVCNFLDDIIKMSKNTTTKPKKQQRAPVGKFCFMKLYFSSPILVFRHVVDLIRYAFYFGQNKNAKVFNNTAQEKALKVRRYMDSRPFVRQVLNCGC